ncbi:class I SAM-dependent methyltransferase [Streptomyces sp. NPDC005820]|uniref:class I SAM-dependent methyltransferase n=1 Tax=Streptomyces sp. NPDC005820 TaxID=3157069 RepID=UPI003408376C
MSGTAPRTSTVVTGRTEPVEPIRPERALLDVRLPSPSRGPGHRPGLRTPVGPGETWTDDLYGHALRTGRGPLFLRRMTTGPDGTAELLSLDVERFCAPPDAADRGVLRRCSGPVLDVGCGPGRLVAALADLGIPALGVDVSPAAVTRTRRHGGTALRRSVFDPLPGEGRWATALLMDGNVGIGGDPTALLARLRDLLRPGGCLLAEAAPQDVDERLVVRVEDGDGRHGRPFPWARVGTTALLRAADATGWIPTGRWTTDARPFLELRRPDTRLDAAPPPVSYGGPARP